MKKQEKKSIKIIGERDIDLHISNPDQHEQIIRISKALSSPVRLKILDILKDTTLSVQGIADLINAPVSSTALNIKVLEDANLIVTETLPGKHGSMKICTCSMQSFNVETFSSGIQNADSTYTIDMPVGNFSQFEIEPTCGLADENGIIGTYDDVRSFYLPEHANAQLLWFQQGFLEYRFPNYANPLLTLQSVSFSLELCSEAPGYQENWPSDITFCVNDHPVITYTSPGDFGARRGRLTPPSWPTGRTQYGLLKSITVSQNGTYLDGALVNKDVTLNTLDISSHSYISLKISIESDAANIGGINIFGKKYGDYDQGIIMNLIYQN